MQNPFLSLEYCFYGKVTIADLNLHMYDINVINVCTQLINYEKRGKRREKDTKDIIHDVMWEINGKEGWGNPSSL